MLSIGNCHEVLLPSETAQCMAERALHFIPSRSNSWRRWLAQGGTGSHLVLLVLASVREARDDGGHSAGGGNLAGVDHDQQLHQHVVDLPTAALHDVHIFPTHGLSHLHTANRSHHNRFEIIIMDLRGQCPWMAYIMKPHHTFQYTRHLKS